MFVFPIVGGAFADALERRRLTISTHAILAVMSVLMAVNASLESPLLWPLYVFAFVSAGLYTFNRPALDTWPARLLGPEVLPSAFALEAGFGSLDSMLGPVAAGLLLATIDPVGAFVFDALHVPGRDRADRPHAAVATLRRGERGELGGDQGRLPIPEGQAHLAVGVPRRPERDDLRLPDRAVPGRGRRVRGPRGRARPALRGAGRRGRSSRSMFSGRAKHVRRQGRAIMVAVVGLGRGDRRVRLRPTRCGSRSRCWPLPAPATW